MTIRRRPTKPNLSYGVTKAEHDAWQARSTRNLTDYDLGVATAGRRQADAHASRHVTTVRRKRTTAIPATTVTPSETSHAA